jgi:hypothetical protein
LNRVYAEAALIEDKPLAVRWVGTCFPVPQNQ